MIRTVKCENGWVRGLEASDPRITSFKGIPYAAPPVGENRWREPQACENWEGELEAYRFAPISMQDTPGIGDDLYCREWHVDSDIPMSEDCLYLNVWTGAKNPEEKLPVLVWFFGGSLQWGYPAEMELDGERLARRGIVVVTINYRLNVFGYMAHPQLTEQQPEAPANFGSLDQQAAMKWVSRNIEAFGGDAQNVTIAGQSAGGGSVMSQLVCLDNEGLFKRAIVMSAMIRNPYGKAQEDIGVPEKLSSAQKNGQHFFEFLGVKSLEEARTLDAVYIRNKYGEYAEQNPRMYTVEDGVFCVGDPLVLYRQGHHVDVSLMAGNTEDEFPMFIEAENDNHLVQKAYELFGTRAKEFLLCTESWTQESKGLYARINGIECTIKDILLSTAVNGSKNKCYYYRFGADIPGWDHPGTFHSVDLWFFFETLAKCWRPFVGRHYDLARKMCNYWAYFIKSGDPNGVDQDESMMTQWQPYTQENPYEMSFTAEGERGSCETESEFRKFIMEEIERRL